MKKFKGFNEQQIKAIAQKLGFNGPVEKFNEFLEASPQAASQFGLMSEKARQIAEGRSFAAGGLVSGDENPGDERPLNYSEQMQIPENSTGTPPDPTTTPAPDAVANPDQPAQQAQPAGTASDFTNTLVQDALNSPNARLPDWANPQTAKIEDNELNYLKTDGKFLDPNNGQNVTASTPSDVMKPDAASMQAKLTTGDVRNEANQLTGVTGTVSDKGQVTAQQMDPSQLAQLGLRAPQISDKDKYEATVQKQLEGLSAQFEDGNIPPWAAGMVRSANAAMAARGLSTSSLAASASVQAAMEAATAIAQTDAQLLSNTNMANLDSRKQKMLSDAAAMSAVDLANLNNRQQAAVFNAQGFLNMDFKNLDNKQQAEVFGFQSIVNSLLSDQAQENAASQFNATSENDVNKFFSELGASIDIARSNLLTSTDVYNSQLQNQREVFNSEMALEIDRANTTWRQLVTTTDTAAQNLSNQLLATLVSGYGTNAFNAQMQLERDQMALADQALARGWTSGENALDRAVDMYLGQLQIDFQRDAVRSQTTSAIGNIFGQITTGVAIEAAKQLDWTEIFSWT